MEQILIHVRELMMEVNDELIETQREFDNLIESCCPPDVDRAGDREVLLEIVLVRLGQIETILKGS